MMYEPSKDQPTKLTIEQCRAKIAESLAMARQARKVEDRIVLEELAEMWSRLAAEIESDKTAK